MAGYWKHAPEIEAYHPCEKRIKYKLRIAYEKDEKKVVIYTFTFLEDEGIIHLVSLKLDKENLERLASVLNVVCEELQ